MTERERGVEALFTKTPIHGFSFIHESKNKVEKYFWPVIMIIFLIILTNDIVKLSNQYINSEPLSKLTLLNLQVVKTPPFIACLNVRGGHIIDSSQFIHNEILHVNFSIGETISQYKTKQEFIDDLSNITSNPFVFFTIFRLIAFISDAEKQLYQRLETYEPIEKEDSYEYDFENFAALEDKIKELDISMTELKNLYAKIIINTYVKTAVFIQITPTGTKKSRIIAENPELWSINYKAKETCVKLDLPEYLYPGPPDPMIHIDVDFTQFHMAHEVYLYDRYLHIYISDDQTNPTYHMLPQILSKYAVDIVSEISVSYTTISEDSKSCGSESVALCQQKCISDLIINICNCHPLFLKMSTNANISEFKSCSYIHNYNNSCAHIMNMTEESVSSSSASCLEKCVPPCELTVFDSTPRDDDVYIALGKATFYGTLSLFNYPNYQHVPVVTWESFVGAFGGTMGIWFGASILSVIHMVFELIRYCCKRKVHQTNVQLNKMSEQAGVPQITSF